MGLKFEEKSSKMASGALHPQCTPRGGRSAIKNEVSYTVSKNMVLGEAPPQKVLHTIWVEFMTFRGVNPGVGGRFWEV